MLPVLRLRVIVANLWSISRWRLSSRALHKRSRIGLEKDLGSRNIRTWSWAISLLLTWPKAEVASFFRKISPQRLPSRVRLLLIFQKSILNGESVFLRTPGIWRRKLSEIDSRRSMSMFAKLSSTRYFTMMVGSTGSDSSQLAYPTAIWNRLSGSWD